MVPHWIVLKVVPNSSQIIGEIITMEESAKSQRVLTYLHLATHQAWLLLPLNCVQLDTFYDSF